MKSSLDVGSLCIGVRDALVLEKADVIASFDYNCATGGIYAPTWDEVAVHDAYIALVNKVLEGLNAYISNYEAFDGS